MPRAPGFWQHGGLIPTLLSPFSVVTAAVTARRMARPGWRAPVPVLCCGNVTVGGAGKTTLVLDLAARLVARGRAVHILLRGYGGRVRGPHRVEPGDSAADVGDEALLLAGTAPTWVGVDRAASARAAVTAGADVLLMDDGLQNPGLVKDMSLLVVDGTTGFGNGLVLPAGPLREPVAVGAARCEAVVLIGPDLTGAARMVPALPILQARLVQDHAVKPLEGRRILPFAGIARPTKFFAPLAEAGAVLVSSESFPDHHPYTAGDLRGLSVRAKALDALLVTTPKDAARLPADFRSAVAVIGVGLAWDNVGALDALLLRLLCLHGSSGKVV